jgi:hypothetical protein
MLEQDIKASQELVREVQKKMEFLEKLDPAENKIKEARKIYEDAQKIAPEIQKNLSKTEKLETLNQYIQEMDRAYNNAKEAEKLIQAQYVILKEQVEKELAILKQIQEMNTMLTRGTEIMDALQKDEFVNRFYNEEKEKVIADYIVLKEALQNENLQKAQENKDAYNRLVAFFEKMKNEKLALNKAHYQLSQTILAKVQGVYQREAESYLEKAKRLKKEVYRLYGKQVPKELNPKTQETQEIKGKVQYRFQNMQPTRVQQQAETGDEEQYEQEEGTGEEYQEDSQNEENENQEDQYSEEESEDEQQGQEGDEEGESQEDSAEQEDIGTQTTKLEETGKISQETQKEEGDEKEAKEDFQEVTQKSSGAEDAMLRQLDNLYNDAESLYEKEEYVDSIQKAKQTIDLAEKILALKKVQKDTKDIRFYSTYTIPEFKSYSVKRGDYLWKISMKRNLLGKAYLWPLIWYANKEKVKNPHMIYPGMMLKIPVFK